MAVEGNFSALLANVIVMEGIVKELNPDINMFSKAASFLMHLRTIDKTIDEAISQIL